MNKQQQPDSSTHDTSTHCPHVHLVSTVGLTVPEKSVAKSFNVWKLEVKKNEEMKGMNKQQQPDSGIHDTSTHFPHVYQVSTL